jgi:hypothetical protein
MNRTSKLSRIDSKKYQSAWKKFDKVVQSGEKRVAENPNYKCIYHSVYPEGYFGYSSVGPNPEATLWMGSVRTSFNAVLRTVPLPLMSNLRLHFERWLLMHAEWLKVRAHIRVMDELEGLNYQEALERETLKYLVMSYKYSLDSQYHYLRGAHDWDQQFYQHMQTEMYEAENKRRTLAN